MLYPYIVGQCGVMLGGAVGAVLQTVGLAMAFAAVCFRGARLDAGVGNRGGACQQ